MKRESPEFRNPGAALKRVNDRYFSGMLRPCIKYGPRIRARGKPAGIICARYEILTKTITVHRVLQDRRVPRWYLDYVVFHELLHMVYGGPHDEAFQAAEAKHPDAVRAKRWEQKRLFDIWWST